VLLASRTLFSTYLLLVAHFSVRPAKASTRPIVRRTPNCVWVRVIGLGVRVSVRVRVRVRVRVGV